MKSGKLNENDKEFEWGAVGGGDMHVWCLSFT